MSFSVLWYEIVIYIYATTVCMLVLYGLWALNDASNPLGIKQEM